MHIRIRHVLTFATLIAAFFVGESHEATRIQRTCEADDGTTVINGQTYLCLSQRQIDNMRRQHEQRGA